MARRVFAVRHRYDPGGMAAHAMVIPARKRILARRPEIPERRVEQSWAVDSAGKEITRADACGGLFVGDGFYSPHFPINDWSWHRFAIRIALHRNPGKRRFPEVEFPAAVFCGGSRQHGKRPQRNEGALGSHQHRSLVVGTSAYQQLICGTGVVLDGLHLSPFSSERDID